MVSGLIQGSSVLNEIMAEALLSISSVFVEGRVQDWSWGFLVASFSRDVARQAVGPGVSMMIRAPIRGTYDHKRHHAIKQQGRPVGPKLPIWDFVLHRADGSGIRLHPQYSTTKVEMFSWEAAAVAVKDLGARSRMVAEAAKAAATVVDKVAAGTRPIWKI